MPKVRQELDKTNTKGSYLMKHYLTLMGVMLLLAACSGSGSGGNGDPELGSVGTGTEDGEEDDGGGIGTDNDDGMASDDTCEGSFICDGDVLRVQYDADEDVLRITGTPFDERAREATYVRATRLDVPGFRGYTNDDEKLFNLYIAVRGESSDGEVEAGTTGIAAYQDFGYSGTFLRINDPSSPPGDNLVQYEGNAAGLIAFNGSGRLLQSYGDVILRVDTTDNYAKGFIINRTFRESLSGETGTLPNLVLSDAEVDGGVFTGDTFSLNGPDQVESGLYTGYFAGEADVIGGKYTGEASTEDMADAPGFSNTLTNRFPVGDGISMRDQGVFIAEEVDHGPTRNPFLDD